MDGDLGTVLLQHLERIEGGLTNFTNWWVGP